MINFTSGVFLKNINKISSPSFKGNFQPVSEPESDVFIKRAKKEEIPDYVDLNEITPELLESLSNTLHNSGKKDFEKYFNLFDSYFNDTGAKLTGRTKDCSSILSKLSKRTKILDCSSDPSFSLIERANVAVPDLNGYRLITSGKPEDVEKIVTKITDLIFDGKLYPSHFFNYEQVPYLTEEQTDFLSKLGFYHNKDKKPSGFSCVNMYFYTDEGKKIELQIMGDKVDKVNDKQHLTYNYKTKGQATENGVVNKTMQNILDSMDSTSMEKYQKYENECYLYSRLLETGETPNKPKLPNGLDKRLALL